MRAALLVGLALLVIGCDRQGSRSERSSGEMVTEQKKASTAKTEMLRAEIKMAAGDLTVEGGGKGEVSADFRYSKGDLAPTFAFDNTSFRARLTIAQSSKDGANFSAGENRWNVKLADGLVTDLSVNLGAGEAKLRLGTMSLRSVSLNMGAGKVTADFIGQPMNDYEVKIRGGVGECEVFLPKGVGIRAEVQGGIGSIDVQGLEKKNGVYENAEFTTGKVKIRLSAHGGIGEIKIIVK